MTVTFWPGLRVTFFEPMFWSPTIATTVAFSASLPTFLTTMVIVTSWLMVTELTLGSTEYTSRSWGEVVVTTTNAVVAVMTGGLLNFPVPVTVRVYVPDWAVELAVMVTSMVAFGEVLVSLAIVAFWLRDTLAVETERSIVTLSARLWFPEMITLILVDEPTETVVTLVVGSMIE